MHNEQVLYFPKLAVSLIKISQGVYVLLLSNIKRTI